MYKKYSAVRVKILVEASLWSSLYKKDVSQMNWCLFKRGGSCQIHFPLN